MGQRYKDKETRIYEIRKAAKKVFSEKGLLLATVDEIAVEAGIGKGTIYEYFKNKEDLYLSLMEPATEKITNEVIVFSEKLKGLNSYNCFEILMGFMKIFYDWYESDVENFNVVSTVHNGALITKMSPETLNRINIIGAKGFKTIRSIIRTAQKKGNIKKKFKDVVIAHLIYSTFLGVVLYEQNKKNITHKDHIYKTLEQAFLILSAGLCSK